MCASTDLICSFCGNPSLPLQTAMEESGQHFMCADCVELAAVHMGKRGVKAFVDFYLARGEEVFYKHMEYCRAVLHGRIQGDKEVFAKRLRELERDMEELRGARATDSHAQTQ